MPNTCTLSKPIQQSINHQQSNLPMMPLQNSHHHMQQQSNAIGKSSNQPKLLVFPVVNQYQTVSIAQNSVGTMNTEQNVHPSQSTMHVFTPQGFETHIVRGSNHVVTSHEGSVSTIGLVSTGSCMADSTLVNTTFDSQAITNPTSTMSG